MEYEISDGSEDGKIPLKPHERFVVGMDTASRDCDAIVYAVLDTLTGKIRIIDVETLGPWKDVQAG